MLKPRYKSLSEAVADFKALLGDMDVRHPKDTTILEEKAAEPAKPIEESKSTPAKAAVIAERAPMSRYASSAGAVNSFRVLAGLEERPNMPWDAGIVAQTKPNLMMMEEAGEMGREMDDPGDAHDNQDAHYAGAEKLHKMMTAKHFSMHDMLHDLDPEQLSHTLQKMGQERSEVAGWLKNTADKAAGRGHHTAANRLAMLSQKHGAAAHAYGSGQTPEPDEEDEACMTDDSGY